MAITRIHTTTHELDDDSLDTNDYTAVWVLVLIVLGLIGYLAYGAYQAPYNPAVATQAANTSYSVPADTNTTASEESPTMASAPAATTTETDNEHRLITVE